MIQADLKPALDVAGLHLRAERLPSLADCYRTTNSPLQLPPEFHPHFTDMVPAGIVSQCELAGT